MILPTSSLMIDEEIKENGSQLNPELVFKISEESKNSSNSQKEQNTANSGNKNQNNNEGQAQ